MVLLIDNYDGCVYNIYQLIGSVNPDVKRVRNDRITPEEIEAMKPSHIVISGGSIPADRAVEDMEIVKKLQGKVPVLGICLGHRAICTAFGGRETHLEQIRQGKVENIILDNHCPLFKGLPGTIKGMLYYSTTVTEKNLPECMEVTARSADGDVMGVHLKETDVYGIQFHPESFLAEYGVEIMRNFLEL